jgi:hypothetical protein
LKRSFNFDSGLLPGASAAGIDSILITDHGVHTDDIQDRYAMNGCREVVV